MRSGASIGSDGFRFNVGGGDETERSVGAKLSRVLGLLEEFLYPLAEPPRDDCPAPFVHPLYAFILFDLQAALRQLEDAPLRHAVAASLGYHSATLRHKLQDNSDEVAKQLLGGDAGTPWDLLASITGSSTGGALSHAISRIMSSRSGHDDVVGHVLDAVVGAVASRSAASTPRGPYSGAASTASDYFVSDTEE